MRCASSSCLRNVSKTLRVLSCLRLVAFRCMPRSSSIATRLCQYMLLASGQRRAVGSTMLASASRALQPHNELDSECSWCVLPSPAMANSRKHMSSGKNAGWHSYALVVGCQIANARSAGGAFAIDCSCGRRSLRASHISDEHA